MDANQRAFINYDQRFEPPEEEYQCIEGLINNELDLLGYYGIRSEDDTPDTARRKIKRSVYKYTDCGAYIEFESDSVVVGSIVEGVDYGTQDHRLLYPFSGEDLDDAIQKVEDEAREIWDSTHGCDACGDPDPYNDGLIAINPNCKVCGGGGTII